MHCHAFSWPERVTSTYMWVISKIQRISHCIKIQRADFVRTSFSTFHWGSIISTWAVRSPWSTDKYIRILSFYRLCAWLNITFCVRGRMIWWIHEATVAAIVAATLCAPITFHPIIALTTKSVKARSQCAPSLVLACYFYIGSSRFFYTRTPSNWSAAGLVTIIHH